MEHDADDANEEHGPENSSMIKATFRVDDIVKTSILLRKGAEKV